MPVQGEVGYIRLRGGAPSLSAQWPPGPGQHLSPSLRCSAASLVSWESEMKHCSSGREKLFCGHLPEAVSAGVGGHQEGQEHFWTPDYQRLVLRKFLDPSLTDATTCFMILGKSWLLCVPQSVHCKMSGWSI